MANETVEDRANGRLSYLVDTNINEVTGDTKLLEIGRQVVQNLEDTPVSVAANLVISGVPNNAEGATETCGIYIRHEHEDLPTSQFINGIYGEVSPNQSWVGGAFTKVIHKGAGDAHYVAMFGDNATSGGQLSGFGGGFGYEAAMFRDRQTGYIATFQGLGNAGTPFPGAVQNQENNIGFQALVHDDGVDPTTAQAGQEAFPATNLALFYASNSLSNAFVTRVSEYANVGFSQFKVMDSNQRPLWSVFGDGQQHMYGAAATSGSQNKASPPFILRGYYWDGANSDPIQAQITLAVSDAPSPEATLRFDLGEPSSETLVCQISTDADGSSNAGLDMQNNVIHNAKKVSFGGHSNGDNVLDLQNGAAINVWGITLSSSGYGIDMQTEDITNVKSITMVGTGDLDMQGADIVQVADLTGDGASTSDISGFYNLSMGGNTGRFATQRTISASSDAGNTGDFCFDANYMYYYAGSEWKRVAWSTF
jgi:hypothetical protein